MDILLTISILALLAVVIFTSQAKDSGPAQQPAPPASKAPSSTPSATSPPVKVNPPLFDINALRYPNSLANEQSADHLSLQSTDSPDAITTWYKERIISLGANVKTFVTTKTNDNVLNNLTGATGKAKITVKITQPAGVSIVSIDVTVFYP